MVEKAGVWACNESIDAYFVYINVSLHIDWLYVVHFQGESDYGS